MNDETFTLEGWLAEESEAEDRVRSEFPAEVQSVEEGLRLFAQLLNSLMNHTVDSQSGVAKCVMVSRLYTDLTAAWLLARRGYWTQLIAIIRHSDEAIRHLDFFGANPDEAEKWLSGKRFEMREIREKMYPEMAARQTASQAYSFLSRLAHPNAEDFMSYLLLKEQQGLGIAQPSTTPGQWEITVSEFPNKLRLRDSLLMTLVTTAQALRSSTDNLRQWLAPSKEWEARFQEWGDKTLALLKDYVELDEC